MRRNLCDLLYTVNTMVYNGHLCDPGECAPDICVRYGLSKYDVQEGTQY